MKTRSKYILSLLICLAALQGASAQHTLGFIAGWGSASGRFEPKEQTKQIWGNYSGGLTWRYYGQQRFVGGFGIDLEFVQQGYSFATNASYVDEAKDFLYYTRRMNSIMLPIVWQPHVYMIRNHVRLYGEAAATFSYNINSTYENQQAKAAGRTDWEGDYPYKLVRDNRWSYGLAFGGGVAFLVSRFEINFRIRYYFGLGDTVRNRSKYYDNGTDGPENPFYGSPQRSPLDNMTFSVGLNYRFNKEGFSTWKPRAKRDKNKEVFKYGF